MYNNINVTLHKFHPFFFGISVRIFPLVREGKVFPAIFIVFLILEIFSNDGLLF